MSGAPDGETGLAASHAESGISAAAGGDWAADAVLAGASAFAGTALAGRCAAGVLVMGGRAGDNAAILTRGPARAVAAGDYATRELAQERLLYLVASTHGDGDPPEEVEYPSGPR